MSGDNADFPANLRLHTARYKIYGATTLKVVRFAVHRPNAKTNSHLLFGRCLRGKLIAS